MIIAHGASGAAFKADVDRRLRVGVRRRGRSRGCRRPTGRRIVFEQNAEPLSLFCADESDGESLRACEQTNESLYRYDGANVGAGPGHGVHAERRLQDLDLQAPRRRQVPRRRDARRQRRRRQLRAPVGHQATRCTRAAPARSTTGPACGAASSTRTAGNASTGNAKAVSVTVLTERFRSDDMVGGAASAAPPTD